MSAYERNRHIREQAKERDFKPVAEFHTQQELWEYVKNA